MGNKAQQEMVGFVLIVVIVIIASLVFLTLSFRFNKKVVKDHDVENILGVVMRYTTKCAEQFEPQYDDVGELISGCYENKRCVNLDEDSCDYLRRSLGEIFGNISETEPAINAYKLKIYAKTSGRSLGEIKMGNCTGQRRGASRIIVVGAEKIIVELVVC